LHLDSLFGASDFFHPFNKKIEMLVDGCFFGLEIPGAECRRESLCNFTVSNRIGFSRDSPVASVKSIVAYLDKGLKALLLRQVDVCLLRNPS
jgi:hypothetical protein